MPDFATATRQVQADRTHYLASSDGSIVANEVTLARDGVQAKVLTWHTKPIGMVTLALGQKAMSLNTDLHPAEARMLASALLMAADDADAASGKALAIFKAAEEAYQQRLEDAYLEGHTLSKTDDEVPA